jgi:hypothetical protein
MDIYIRNAEIHFDLSTEDKETKNFGGISGFIIEVNDLDDTVKVPLLEEIQKIAEKWYHGHQ